MTINVSMELNNNHQIIAQASQLHTGSQIIVAAQKTVVNDVRIIGANLTYHAFNKASSIVSLFFFKIFK